MLRSCNSHVALAICSLFNSTKDSDCEIILCQEKTLCLGIQNPNDFSEPDSTGAQACTREVLAEPMPAHQFVLRYASERFAAQLARWGSQDHATGAVLRISNMQLPCTQVTEGKTGPAQLSVPQEQKQRHNVLHANNSSSLRTSQPQQQSSSAAEQELTKSTADEPAAPAKQPPTPPRDSRPSRSTQPLSLLPSPSLLHQARGPVQPMQKSSQLPLPIRRLLACSSDWPQLFIPLGSPDEVPSTRAAIQFAYTGEVATDNIREVLEMRRQGAYLQIYGCVEACDRVIQVQLMAAAVGNSVQLYGVTGAGVGVGGDGGGDASGQASHNGSSSSYGVQAAAALELFACEALWPDLDAEPAFATLVEAAKPFFVAHFGDTLKALNSPPLKQQLLELPAAALEVLLSSDDFGTDSESSILLLLAMWMRVNCDKTDAQTRERLCRIVRLVHLSRPYLILVLPALAADYEKDPDAPAGWYPIDPMDAAFVVGFVHAPLPERRKLLEVNAPGRAFSSSHWLRLEPRTLCIPDEGLVFRWHIPQQELLAQLQQLQAQPGTPRRCYATFGCGELSVAAWGLVWRVSLAITGDAPAAGLFVWCGLPMAMCAPGSRLARKDGPRVLTQFVAQVVVHRRHPGLGNVEVCFGPEDLLEVGLGLGWPQILFLRQPEGLAAAAGGGGGGTGGGGGMKNGRRGGGGGGGNGGGSGAGTGAAQTGAGSAGGDLLAKWMDYLQDGWISGTLTLLRQG